MDFRLNEDQLALQQMVREFTDKEIRPVAAEMDETGEFNEELWNKMADLGLFGILAPEEYGGSGLDHVSFIIAMEDRKSTRLNSSHNVASRMPSSA